MMEEAVYPFWQGGPGMVASIYAACMHLAPLPLPFTPRMGKALREGTGCVGWEWSQNMGTSSQ